MVRGLRDLGASLRGYLFPPTIQPREPPFDHEDEAGRSLHVRAYDDHDFEGLVEMYRAFSMDDRAQGTPPLGEAAIREWVAEMAEGINVVAVHGDEPVGHVMFVPDADGRHELAIFVHPSYQRAGIGTRLMAGGLGQARAEGVDFVWLSVEATEWWLVRFYQRAGFSATNPMGMYYRMTRYL